MPAAISAIRPSLTNVVRSRHPDPSTRNQPLKTGRVNETARAKKELQNWHTRVWKRDFEDAVFGPSGILKDEVLENLASVGPILRLVELERVVGSQWAWFGEYGDELLAALGKMEMRPMQPKPPQTRTTKRPSRVNLSSSSHSTNPNLPPDTSPPQ